MTTFTANLLTALISATLGALIAYLLAFRRFREEKWWERKAEAYIHIMEALHQKFNRAHIDAHFTRIEVSSENDIRLRKIAEENRDEILRVGDVGKLFLPSKAIDRLNRYMRDSEHVTANDWDEYIAKDLEVIEAFADDLVLIAREDLGVSSKGKRWDFADRVHDRLSRRQQSRAGGERS